VEGLEVLRCFRRERDADDLPGVRVAVHSPLAVLVLRAIKEVRPRLSCVERRGLGQPGQRGREREDLIGERHGSRGPVGPGEGTREGVPDDWLLEQGRPVVDLGGVVEHLRRRGCAASVEDRLTRARVGLPDPTREAGAPLSALGGVEVVEVSGRRERAELHGSPARRERADDPGCLDSSSIESEHTTLQEVGVVSGPPRRFPGAPSPLESGVPTGGRARRSSKQKWPLGRSQRTRAPQRTRKPACAAGRVADLGVSF
jgi:hypothetical protein